MKDKLLGLKRNLDSEEGSIAIITILILTSLFGATALAIDMGLLYQTKARIQAAADASALAGAQELMESDNVTYADQVCADYINNNVSEPYNSNINVDRSSSSVTVKLTKEVKFFFAPLIGIEKTTVSASATAAASTIIRMRNIVPFGVVDQEFKYGEQYILKYGAGGNSNSYHGNYGALALGGNGASTYRDNIKYGYQGELGVGDRVNTEPGNMAGPTDQGVSYRKSQCVHGCNFTTQIEANCPRVVITPVIDSLDVNGRKEVTIVGFAAFFLEETVQSESKGQKDVVGRFLKWTTTGELGQGTNYGVYSVMLIK